ncbi:MAG TPA: NUDIX domain-containing protein [Candidatus Limnocylindrales bacterium]|jgi:predicted NUDIX family phosphoesterase
MGNPDELVYAVRRQALMAGLPGWRGVWTGDPTAVFRRIEDEGDYFPRPATEVDRSLKQIIPYLVLRDGQRIFLMKRTRAGGDARLHDHYTIGVGGHMNPGDDSVVGGLLREWHEELEADFIPEFRFLGLLNDDTVEVGMHHLGVVYVGDAAGRSVAVRETHKLSGSFETVATVRDVYDRMETWSQLALEALLAESDQPPADPSGRFGSPS